MENKNVMLENAAANYNGIYNNPYIIMLVVFINFWRG